MPVHRIPIARSGAARPLPRQAPSGGFASRVLEVAPDVSGLVVGVSRDGHVVTLDNRTGQPVVVLGYDDEEYLRVGPDGGIEENLLAVSSLIHAGVDLLALRARRAPAPEPLWRPVGAGTVVAWEDLRCGWRLPDLPPPVEADPARPVRVLEWRIPLRVGVRPVVVRGELDWLGRRAG